MLIFSFDLMFTHKLKILLQKRDARNIGFPGFTEMHVFEEKEQKFFYLGVDIFCQNVINNLSGIL